MIRNIFFPQKINDYYLFKKKVVSFTLSKQTVSAFCLILNARTKTITHDIHETIAYDQYESPELALTATIKKILSTIGSYNELIVVINSTHAIFKELTIPLIDEEKITQIIGFELENYLPFSINNAVFDFIITQQDIVAKNSTVFTVAIQKEIIDNYAQLFTDAGTKVDVFSIDAFNIYDLFVTTQNNIEEKARLLVVSDNELTTAVYLEGKQLKKIRILEESPEYTNEAWWKTLNFTFESCTENWPKDKELIFYGNYSSEFLSKAKLLFPINCIDISIDSIINTMKIEGLVSEKQNTISLSNLAASLDLPITTRCNLQPSTKNIDITKTAIGNYITSSLLLLLLYGSFGFYAFFEIKKFSDTSEKIKSTIMKDLKTALPSLKATSAGESIRKAKAEITKEEDIWFSFSSQTRHSFLTYLYDLSTMIDRDTLGLDLKKMTFNKNGITLDGSVRSFDAVEELIKQLKNTNLFTQVPNLQKTEFSMPLTLINQEERS